MPISRSSLCLVLIAGAALFAGCEAEVSTGGNDINQDEVAKVVQSQYAEKNKGLKLTEIDCGTTEAKVGNTFTCDATNSVGITLVIEGTINSVDEDTDRADYTTKTIKATSDGTVYADAAVTQLNNEGYAVDALDCPEILIEKGNKVECGVTMDNGTKQTAELTLTNGDGGFHVDTSGPLPGDG